MKDTNTTDPIERRKQQIARQQGSKTALLGILIGQAMILLGGILIARSIFGFLEQDMANSNEPPLAIFGMVAGLPFIIFGLFVHFGSSRRFTGKLLSSPGIGPGAVLFMGLAIGAWWGALSLPAMGSLWLIPSILSIIAGLLLLTGILMRMRRSAKYVLLTRMIKEGKIVAAVITDIPEIEPNSSGLIGTITVKFTDMNGVDRWVQKTGQWKRQDLPKTGDMATVLYDSKQPENVSRIWVGPPGSATIKDFTLWYS
ncbi:hypothetical protein C1637_15420 [Chryseobacterium lactis]|uniref:DUF3592 domain-containing protein n=1 Tax=Chryseobacterium lactis TaxID=1241981 RepID=A0A3G6RGH0_CHRLC|nr:hypothetical protein [Chryseobacterium lactis]AZA83501.1 hypothetical protein EG342_17145 [Chryseobacterium lactis]AZB03885.1 hypothetical protein EG341_08020 [Chryseobacterium lactis]PNW13205.1 hypothetical protein C1637_15420 [Chryseobacterium lactis]